MCERTPCLGTPHDILALIEAGYEDYVCYTEWAAGINLGFIDEPIPMVQLKSKRGKTDGCCICYHDGKCELHLSGLKPTEGKLSHHDVSARELQPQYNLSFQVALEWINVENYGIVEEIADRLNEYLSKKENVYEQEFDQKWIRKK